ncbi:unnamed protein product, partial [Ectocarpus sp. 12 AP-2014]
PVRIPNASCGQWETKLPDVEEYVPPQARFRKLWGQCLEIGIFLSSSHLKKQLIGEANGMT